MLYEAHVPLIIKGDLKPKGSQFELSVEEATQFDPADLSPVGAEPAPEEEVLKVVPIEEMTYAELKEEAKKLELSQAGSRADLLERITLHLQGKVEEEMEPHIVTEEDLVGNPELAEKGVKVGDEIMLPKEEKLEEI